ncbi:MAG: hypothetical protein P4L83_13340 [Nevskia sp.]|nr:hypothetical protein [Nevskia sp.]
MNDKSISDQDRRRKKALIVFQILIYGYLLGLFLLQLHMYSTRDW